MPMYTERLGHGDKDADIHRETRRRRQGGRYTQRDYETETRMPIYTERLGDGDKDADIHRETRRRRQGCRCTQRD